MMALQHSLVRKSLHWHACYKFLNAKVKIFSLSYAVIPSFLVSALFIDPYFIFKFIIFNILSLFSVSVIACSVLCNYSIRMTVVLGVSQPWLLSCQFATVCCTSWNLAKKEAWQMLSFILNPSKWSWRLKDKMTATRLCMYLCCHAHFNDLFSSYLALTVSYLYLSSASRVAQAL